MDNRNEEAVQKGMSRRKFISAMGIAGATVIASGLLGNKLYAEEESAVNPTDSPASANATEVQHFAATLDDQGAVVIPHGLGASLPANVWLMNAFLKMPEGHARRIEVDSVDASNIVIRGGLPNTPVRVAVLYSTAGQSW